MRALDRITSDRRLLLGTVILILLLAAFVRLYHIEWSFSNNGIDEGIMIQRARLVGDGYALYSDLPCDQAPLAFYLGAPFNGDVISLRSLSAVLSIAAIAAVMEAARRVKGNLAMIAAGLLISFDFAFLRESRLFSLDGISTSFLAFSILAFVISLQRNSRLMLVVAGLFVGVSAATKLFGVLGLLGMILWILLETRRAQRGIKSPLIDMALLVVASAVPLLAFMAYLGPDETLNGMLFNQGQRTFDPWLKLSLVAYFGMNLAYLLPLVYVKKTWSMGREARFLLCVAAVILAFMIVQPLVFFHHLPLMSPALATLSGSCLAEWVGAKNGSVETPIKGKMANKRSIATKGPIALFCVTILVSCGLAGYGLLTQKEPPQIRIADDLSGVADSSEWIICGDPLICAYADRNIPPEVVNVAYRQHPDLTLADIEQVINDYDVEVVVLSYRLSEMNGLRDLLREYNFTAILPSNNPNWSAYWEDSRGALDFFQEDIGPVSIYWRGTE